MSSNPPEMPPGDQPWHPPSASPSQPGGTPPQQPWPGPPPTPPQDPRTQGQWAQPQQWGAAPPGAPPAGWQSVPPGGFGGYQAPPKPGIIPLRPLGLGDILDGAFQACRKNPLSTFGTAILFQLVVAVVTVLLTFGLTGSLATFDPFTASVEETSGFVASLLSITTVLVLMTAVGILILQGVLIIPIARAVLNQKTGFSQLWKLAGRRILPLIGLGALLVLMWTVAIVVLVLIFVGLALALEEASIAIIIIGVLGALAAAAWINIKFVLAPATLMLEGAGPINALKRSWTLTTRNWWRTFGILILTSIIVSIITQVVATPISLIVFTSTSFSTSPETASAEILQSLPALLITQAITAVFTAIGYAFQAGVTALLYVDLRIRREGFDVVLLREHESATPGNGNAIPGQSRGPGSQEFGHNPQSPEDPRPGAWN